MTSQSPRIYLYKITFEEVPYYYYGVHKETKYNDYYMGSPVTHKWIWEFYTPKKQILQFFDFTDNGWFEAQEVEKRLIKPVYNTDKWCLNESCGTKMSLDIRRVVGKKLVKMKLGLYGLTEEEKRKNSQKAGQTTYERNVGIFSLSEEEKTEARSKGGRTSGKTQYKLRIGIFSQTPQQRSELGKSVCSQKWECLETGFIANPGNLTRYQKKRGIDTSKRKRIE